jgi:RHS repeat-associated protein
MMSILRSTLSLVRRSILVLSVFCAVSFASGETANLYIHRQSLAPHDLTGIEYYYVTTNIVAGGVPDGQYRLVPDDQASWNNGLLINVVNGVASPAIHISYRTGSADLHDNGNDNKTINSEHWNRLYDNLGTLLASGFDKGYIVVYAPLYDDVLDSEHYFTDTVNLGDLFSEPAPDLNKTGLCDANTGCPAALPMAQYSIHLLLASLHIEDTPISYNSPRGPSTAFKVVYNQREANQPVPFTFCNFGSKWTFNWLSYVTDNPADPNANADVYVRGGGTETCAGFNSGTQSYAPGMQSMAVLFRTSSTSYERRMPDGSKEVYSLPDGSSSYPRRVFLTSAVDPTGNSATVGYGKNFRITSITDSLGQVTTLAYELQTDTLKITKVTDPFGRFATFEYTNGQLTRITDPVGIQSQFGYETGTDFINAMTTPYGTTTFAKGESGNSYRWLEATDPLSGKERVEYTNSATGISATESVAPAGVYNNKLDVHNSFYWNKKAMADAPGDYTKARMTHWLKSANGTKISGIKHSEKAALENRVWYKYGGQENDGRVGANALPTHVKRVLDDGSTVQSNQFEYNSLGNLTKETDPAGRVFSYTYASNGIDLLEKRQTRGTNNELVASFTYNSPIAHLPDTATDAARETTTYVYNSYGQLRTVTNAKSEMTTYVYDRDQNGDTITDGYVLSITGPVTGATTTYHYDSAKRIDTLTDSESYVLTFGYDNIDRPTSITYPDTTTKQFKYTKYLNGADTGLMRMDLGASKDRRGHWTYREYDANRQLTKITDPLGRNTLFGWCTCGSLGSITDGNTHVTSFVRDVQGRVTSKVFHDTKSIAYVYENTTSRLKSMTDAKNQRTNYSYFVDNDLQQISYTNTSGQPLSPPTPTVNFTFDPNYNRVATMADGTGSTTFTYNPITGTVSPGAGQLYSVDGPLANDTIVYGYDELGRRLSASVNGVAASQTYDSLGRIGTMTNPLGIFTNTYLSSVSPRLQSTTSPSRPTVTYSYFSNSADKRLQTIQNNTSGGTLLSKFDYVYDADGEIASLTRQLGPTGFPMVWNNLGNPMNDAADQLTNLTEQRSIDQFVGFSWGYDNAGNRTSDNSGTYSINTVNQITNSGYLCDNNGNLTADPSRTYEWDAADRLIAINYPAVSGMRSEFTYDGLSRRVKIVEKGLAAPVLDWTFQPTNTNYNDYSAPGSYSLSAGSYTLKLQGLNPNGGDNTVLLDAVKLLKNGNNVVTNSGFETPVLPSGTFQYNPSGATWSFTGNGGISRNNSTIASGNPPAPGGIQLGFLQMNSSMSQSVSVNTGSHTFTLKAAQRAANPTYQQVRVTVQSPTIVVTSTKQFVWNGTAISEERDANNAVTRRFYAQGEQISGTNYFYTRDHLGSVREMIDSTGAIRARYDHDPYGYRTKLSGDLDASFAYTGHYFHQPSGLNVALHRAYDVSNGRWINRDPIGELAGINLYAYVRNDPMRFVDPLGLEEDLPPFGVGAGTQGAQNRARDGADLVNLGSKVAYPSDGKGFFEPPSICTKIIETLKFIFGADQLLRKYQQECPPCDEKNHSCPRR